MIVCGLLKEVGFGAGGIFRVQLGKAESHM
jgi:hypothetical protein